jgi:uncharacterized protein (TIGR01777 family)
MRTRFSKESFFSASKRELFEFHERDDAFSLLTPASANVDVESTASTLAPSDDVVRFAVGFGPFRFRFENVHTVYEPFDRFVDEQRKGLFTEWRHEHRFVQAGWEREPATMLSDDIVYAHPLLPLFDPFVKHRLGRLFEHRHRITAREVHAAAAKRADKSRTRIVVTGATGLIGRRVVQILVEQGVEVIAFVRDVDRARTMLGEGVVCVRWDFHRPEEGDWRRHLAEAEGVVHLAGTPLFKKRWSPAFKREMEQSRTLGTRQLVDGIIESGRKPRVFVSASAVGYYGTKLGRATDEDSPPGDDLLAQICVNWENEARRLDDHGVRTVLMRMGVVLSTESGVLRELIPLFRLGIGATMGDPEPHINWIHIEDAARMFAMALANEQMRGPHNAAGPTPVTNREFAKAIGRALRRPALLRLPVPLLKLVIGEAGAHASGGPKANVDRIRAAGYRFFFSDLNGALSNLLRTA